MKTHATIGTELRAEVLAAVHGGIYNPLDTVRQIGGGLSRAGRDAARATGKVVKEASHIIGDVVGALKALF